MNYELSNLTISLKNAKPVAEKIRRSYYFNLKRIQDKIFIHKKIYYLKIYRLFFVRKIKVFLGFMDFS